MRTQILSGFALVDEECDEMLLDQKKTLEERQQVYIIQVRNLKMWVELNNEK